MRQRFSIGVLFFVATLGTSACSDRHSATTPPPAAPPDAVSQQGEHDANVTRAKLNANGIPAQYAARFENGNLVQIEEERSSTGSALTGEYSFQGARLLRYRGAKVSAPGTVDLEFDLQGAVTSGRGPDVSDEEIATLRTRAQLLRSHALAQRDARSHSNGY